MTCPNSEWELMVPIFTKLKGTIRKGANQLVPHCHVIIDHHMSVAWRRSSSWGISVTIHIVAERFGPATIRRKLISTTAISYFQSLAKACDHSWNIKLRVWPAGSYKESYLVSYKRDGHPNLLVIGCPHCFGVWIWRASLFRLAAY